MPDLADLREELMNFFRSLRVGGGGQDPRGREKVCEFLGRRRRSADPAGSAGVREVGFAPYTPCPLKTLRTPTEQTKDGPRTAQGRSRCLNAAPTILRQMGNSATKEFSRFKGADRAAIVESFAERFDPETLPPTLKFSALFDWTGSKKPILVDEDLVAEALASKNIKRLYMLEFRQDGREITLQFIKSHY
jgi:hypothetical protein